MKSFVAVGLFSLLASQAGAVDFGPRPAKPSNLTVYLTGDSADAPNTAVGGPAILLMGGGTEVDAGFSTQAYPIINGGDILVLRTTGSNGYNDYLYNLVTGPLKPNSVETIIPNSVSKANSDYVEWACNTAEMIWFAGGDQSTYTSNWRGTKLQAAVQAAYERGAVVGGTSAGMDLLSEYIFDPIDGSAPTGATAITNPYLAGNTLTDFFLSSPLMANTVNDAHFFQRDRMGRPLSWMAQLRQDARAPTIMSIAGDEMSSIFIDKNRIGHALTGTSGRAMYVMWEDAQTTRTQVVAGQPLIYSNVLRARLTAGDTFDFNTMTGSVCPIRLSVNGGAATPYNPADPYTTQAGVCPTATPSPSATPNDSPTPTESPTPTPTETPAPTVTASPTIEPSPTDTPMPTPTEPSAPTVTASPTIEPSPTDTPMPSPTVVQHEAFLLL